MSFSLSLCVKQMFAGSRYNVSSLCQVMSFYTTDEREKERLQYFASAEGRDDLYNYNQKERKSVLEVTN